MHLTSYIITTHTSSNSLFVPLTRQSTTPLILYVSRDPKDPVYTVITYTKDLELLPRVNELLRNRDSKILSLNRFISERSLLMIAVKERCEFYELIENYGVTLLSPYIVKGGKRIFCVMGEEEHIEKYIDNLQSYYGKKNITAKRSSLAECIENTIKVLSSNYAKLGLTSRELYILNRAYQEGYFGSKRSIQLEELAKQLNLSKPTTSIMLRKAIGKVLRNIFENEDLEYLVN